MGSVTVEVTARDGRAVHRALAEPGDEVRISLARKTAELVARGVDAQARGEHVLVTRGNAEVTPNQAAELLGASRQQVRKMMDRGALESRKVGSQHRISVASIQRLLEAERPRRKRALADLTALQNDLGLTE